MSNKRKAATSTWDAKRAKINVPPPISVANVVCAFNVDYVQISIDKLVKKLDACAYNGVKFAAAILRLKKPRCAALIFSSGSIVCPGTKSPHEALNAAWRCTRYLQKWGGIECTFGAIDVKNVVSAAECPFQIFIDRIHSQHPEQAKYKPDNFPGLIYRDPMRYDNVTFLVYVSGKVVVTGAKTEQESRSKWEAFYAEVLSKHLDVDGKLGGMDSSEYKNHISLERDRSAELELEGVLGLDLLDNEHETDALDQFLDIALEF